MKLARGVFALLILSFSFPFMVEAAGIKLDEASLKEALSGYHGIPDAGYIATLDKGHTVTLLKKILQDQPDPTNPGTGMVGLLKSRAIYMLMAVDSSADSIGFLQSRLGKDSKGNLKEDNEYFRASIYDVLGKAADNSDPAVDQTTIDIVAEGLNDEESLYVNSIAAHRLMATGNNYALQKLEAAVARKQAAGAGDSKEAEIYRRAIVKFHDNERAKAKYLDDSRKNPEKLKTGDPGAEVVGNKFGRNNPANNGNNGNNANNNNANNNP